MTKNDQQLSLCISLFCQQKPFGVSAYAGMQAVPLRTGAACQILSLGRVF